MARGLRTLVEGESVFNDGVAVVLYLIEVGLSLALAYGAYLAAERLEVSGVIAVVVAGLIMGNHGRIFSVSPSTRLSLSHFWEVGAFLINRLIFLLIGLSVERGHLLGHAGRIGVGFLIMLAVRGFVVYGTLGGYRWLARRSFPISWIHVAN